MRSIVLASTSPYRKQLLQQLQVPFIAASPVYHEEIDQGVAPELLVKHLAVHKAKSLLRHFPQALIIGADQVFVDSRRRILGKPGSLERAAEQLRGMAGRSHTFYTGLAVLDAESGESQVDFVTFTVTLRPLAEEEIQAYLRRETPFDCAGSFKIEGLGIALMEKMEGEDYTALIGLPLIKLGDFLRHFGVKVLLGKLRPRPAHDRRRPVFLTALSRRCYYPDTFTHGGRHGGWRKLQVFSRASCRLSQPPASRPGLWNIPISSTCICTASTACSTAPSRSAT